MTAAVAERAMERQPKGTPGRVGSWWTAWRLALRMARREVRRDRGRSWFVWLMISVPVAAICGTQVVLASQDVSPAEFLELRLGGATSRLTWVGHAFVPGTDPYRHAVDTENSTPASPAAPIPGWGDDLGTREAALAAWTGSEALTVTVGSATVDEGGYGVVVLGIDTSRPAAADIVRLTAGRLPSGPGEVVATPAWLSLGLPSRGPVTLLDENDRARTVDVVGTAQTRFDQVVYLVGAPDPAVPDPSFLLAGFNPDWQTAQELAQHGFATTSRAIADAPPAGTAEMGQNPNLFYGGLVGTGALLEVALLVGPAFAIGAARQRRSLALAACNGATAGQLRRLTLGQALLLGSTAATVGIVAGTLAGAAAWPIVSADPTQLNGPLEIPATFLLLIWALGTATAVAAALVSSRGLGRLDLVAALRGTVRPAGPN